MRKKVGIAALTVMGVLMLGALGANPRYIEELALGGGFDEAVDGGADFEKNGTIRTNGAISTDADVTVGDGVGGALLHIDGNVGTGREVVSYTAGSRRWRLILGTTVAESGSDVGSDLLFQARSDSDGLIDNPIDIQRESGGTITLGGSSNRLVDATGDLNVEGGDFSAGLDSSIRGVVTAWDGSGGSAPGTLQLASPNGTTYFVFVEDDGTLKLHTALPTANSDGSEVGSQS